MVPGVLRQRAFGDLKMKFFSAGMMQLCGKSNSGIISYRDLGRLREMDIKMM